MEADLTFDKVLKIAQGLEAAEGCAKELDDRRDRE